MNIPFSCEVYGGSMCIPEHGTVAVLGTSHDAAEHIHRRDTGRLHPDVPQQPGQHQHQRKSHLMSVFHTAEESVLAACFTFYPVNRILDAA